VPFSVTIRFKINNSKGGKRERKKKEKEPQIYVGDILGLILGLE